MNAGNPLDPIAESDLDDIIFYIAFVDRRPITGERLYFEIRDKIAEQAKQSLRAHRHPQAPEGWPYMKHKR